MLLSERWTILDYHAEQARCWRSAKRFRAVVAGRGSGKSEIEKRRLVASLPIPKPWADPRYFFGAPTFAQAKRIAWRDLKAMTPNEWIKGEPSESELRIDTVFGSSLHVVGMDKPQRVEGTQWDGCVLDESSDLKPGAFGVSVSFALTHRQGWCSRIGVPKRHGIGRNEFKAFYDSGLEGDADIDSFHWTSGEILDESQLEFMRKNLDKADMREQAFADWVNATGQIFDEFDRDLNSSLCTYDPARTLVIGSDFNVSPMCWVIGHRWANRLEIFDEISRKDMTTRRTLDILHEKYPDHQGGWEFYGDASGRARKTSAATSDYIQIANDTRFEPKQVLYPRSNPAVVDRFAATNAMLCNADGDRRLLIDPECTALITDLESRTWKPGTREANDTADIGHISDALGYIIHRLWPSRVELPQTSGKVLIHVPSN